MQDAWHPMLTVAHFAAIRFKSLKSPNHLDKTKKVERVIGKVEYRRNWEKEARNSIRKIETQEEESLTRQTNW